MILFLKKSVPNKDYVVNGQLDASDIQRQQTEAAFAFMPPSGSAPATFYSPFESTEAVCKYPLNIKELFPYWLRTTENGESALITLTDSFYQWLCCGNTDINSVSFFRLEDLINIQYIPDTLITHLANTYLNALPVTEALQYVTTDKIKNIVDNIKINLYAIKGTENSFKYLINELFGVEPENITVVYPKKYVLRLNGGRYDWMWDTPNTTDYSANPDDFYPQLTGSRLNYSVFYDNDVWQEHSYVVNASGISAAAYNTVVRPLVHPAGTKDFFNPNIKSLNTVVNPVQSSTYEIPIVANYSLYLLGSTANIGPTFGCSAALGGVTGYPLYTFPSWDIDIAGKYYSGMTFGQINIGDFLYLSPETGFTYPNAGITCG